MVKRSFLLTLALVEVLACVSCSHIFRDYSPEAQIQEFVKALSVNANDDMGSSFAAVSRALRYSPGERTEPDSLVAELKHSDYHFILSANPLLVGPFNSQTSPKQFVLGLLILPTPAGKRNFVQNELTRTLGPPAGLDRWSKPTWFISGGMVTAKDENIASYYSSAYTGDHLDQIENQSLPVLPPLATVAAQLSLDPWNRYPMRDSLEWKGCTEQWFVRSSEKAPLSSPDVTLYFASPSDGKISGVQLVIPNLRDTDPAPIANKLLAELRITGAEI